MLIFYNETNYTPTLDVKSVSENGFGIILGLKDEATTREFKMFTTSDADVYELLKTKMDNRGKGLQFRYPTGRFYCKPPVGKFGYTNKCELITFDPKDDDMRKTARNVVIIIKDKNSQVTINPSIVGVNEEGKPDFIIKETYGDVEIVAYIIKFNNWAKLTRPTYIYIDGVNGKKQLKLGYTKTGPEKQYTSNALFEEEFDGDEFPTFTREKKFRPRYNNRNDNTRDDDDNYQDFKKTSKYRNGTKRTKFNKDRY